MGLSELGASALGLAERGWAVFPLQYHAKEPLTEHGFKQASTDLAGIQEYWERNPEANVGVATGDMSGGVVVIDCDLKGEKDGLRYVSNWQREHGSFPTTAMQQTGSGGYQFFFLADRPIGSSSHKDVAVDVRGDGGYVVVPPSIHPCGEAYKWEYGPEQIARANESVYALIEHLQSTPAAPASGGASTAGAAKYELPAVIAEGGRDEAMYKFGCSLRAQCVPEPEMLDRMREENEARCVPPLSDREVIAKWRSACGRPEGLSAEAKEMQAKAVERKARAKEAKPEPKAGPDGEVPDFASGTGEGDELAPMTREEAEAEPWRVQYYKGESTRTQKGRPIHHVVGKMIIDLFSVCRLNSKDGAPAVFLDGCYELGWDAVDKAATIVHEGVKLAEKKEIRDFVKLRAPVRMEAAPEWIPFKDCLVNVITNETLPHSREMPVANIIPHKWDPDAKNEELDTLLSRMACGDSEMVDVLYEIAGVCLYRSNNLSQCPILLGDGANGKSTYIRLLRRMLGYGNYSVLDLEMLGKHFQAGQIAGKMANLGDDIGSEILSSDTMATFKKIASGEDVYTDVKNKDGFTFRPYCTLVFSANNMPPISDKTNGMFRRLYPLKFNAHFTPDSPDYDPDIAARVTSDETALQALLAGAMRALKRVIRRGAFASIGQGSDELREIRVSNSSVLQWLEWGDRDANTLYDEDVKLMYQSYNTFCSESNLKAMSRRNFTTEIKRELGLESKPVNGKRVFKHAKPQKTSVLEAC